jgi:hypothetical protein
LVEAITQGKAGRQKKTPAPEEETGAIPISLKETPYMHLYYHRYIVKGQRVVEVGGRDEKE